MQEPPPLVWEGLDEPPERRAAARGQGDVVDLSGPRQWHIWARERAVKEATDEGSGRPSPSG